MALLFAGSAHADMVDGVKGAVLPFDRSMTIGQAFDGWSNCASTEWKHIQTDRGQNIVISICHMRDAQEFLSRVATSPAVSSSDMPGAIHLRGVRRAMFVLQWNINVDGTLQLGHAEQQYAWADGKYLQIPLNLDQAITQVYEDVVFFSLPQLTSSDELATLQVARAYNQIFYGHYRNASTAQ